MTFVTLNFYSPGLCHSASGTGKLVGIREFRPQKKSHRHCEPYCRPIDTLLGLHITDLFIFRDCFIYSNCGQFAQSEQRLKHLDQGSMITFGSNVNEKRVLDSVFVVSDSSWNDPLNPRETLADKVTDEFMAVTDGPMIHDPNMREAADKGEAPKFRLYLRATPNLPVDGMSGFFPAIATDSEAGFTRPSIPVDTQTC